MGIDFTSCPQEENISPEEETEIYGWERAQGRYQSKQVLSVWQCKESAFALSALRQW